MSKKGLAILIPGVGIAAYLTIATILPVPVFVAFLILALILISICWFEKLRVFLIIALAEHIVITLAVAAVIYTKPPDNDQERQFEVDLLELPPKKEELPEEEQVQIVIPQGEEQIAVSDKLPSFQFQRTGSQYLGRPDSDIKLPNLPRTAGADINPDQMFSAPKTRDAEQGERANSNTILPFRDAPNKPGLYGGPIARDTFPEKGNKSTSAGRIGTPTSKNIADAPSLGASRKPGVGPGGIQITGGEVQGREVEDWPDIPEYLGKEVGRVVLKFWVTPQGDVINVQTKLKAGDPQLEKLAKRYVEGIKFASLHKRAKQRNQWGEITIDFTKKKVKQK